MGCNDFPWHGGWSVFPSTSNPKYPWIGSNIESSTGGVTSGFVADLWGRRAAILAGAILSAVGVAVEYIAATPSVLLVGKIVCFCYLHTMITSQN